MQVGRDFFPAIDGGQIKLHVRAPAGTRIEATEVVFEAVEGKIRQVIPERERDLIVDDIGIPQRLYNLSFTDGSTIGPNDGVILKTAGEAAVLLLTGQRLIATSVPTRCYETTDRSIHETRRVAKKTYRPFATQQQHALLCFTINSQYFTVDRPRFLSGHTARNANTSLRSNPWPTQRKSTTGFADTASCV